jgi:hypothetical protein
MAHTSGFFGQSFVEAPAMFKRNGVYYAVFGMCCCYCQQGSPVTVYTAPAALGPYTQRNAIDATHGACSQTNATYGASRAALNLRRGEENVRKEQLCRRASGIHAQQTDIFPYVSTTGLQFMWMGDRWQSAPDGIKGHDFTFWYPMQFDATGNVTAMRWVDSFSVDLP